MRFSAISLFLFPLFFSKLSKSQTNDAGLWTSINIERRITPKLFVSMSEEIRLRENLSRAGTVFTDLGLALKWDKIKISGNYRYTFKQQLDGNFQDLQRFYIDIQARKKLNLFTLTNRIRIQNQYKGFRSSEKLLPEYYFREAVIMKFRPEERFRPYFSFEMFFSLLSEYYLIDNLRLKAGGEYSINEKNSLEGFYLVQKEMNVVSPVTDFVIGLGYGYKF